MTYFQDKPDTRVQVSRLESCDYQMSRYYPSLFCWNELKHEWPIFRQARHACTGPPMRVLWPSGVKIPPFSVLLMPALTTPLFAGNTLSRGPITTGGRYDISDDSLRLVIKKLVVADNGDYVCIADQCTGRGCMSGAVHHDSLM